MMAHSITVAHIHRAWPSLSLEAGVLPYNPHTLKCFDRGTTSKDLSGMHSWVDIRDRRRATPDRREMYAPTIEVRKS